MKTRQIGIQTDPIPQEFYDIIEEEKRREEEEKRRKEEEERLGTIQILHEQSGKVGGWVGKATCFLLLTRWVAKKILT